MTQPTPFQLIVLLCCAASGLIIGFYGLVKPLPSSQSHPLKRIAGQLLDVGFMVFSILILSRRAWAFDGLIFCFALAILDSWLTFHSEDFPITKRVAVAKVRMCWTVFASLCLGIPTVLLIWLRPILTAK
jgi:hypothetical protein